MTTARARALGTGALFLGLCGCFKTSVEEKPAVEPAAAPPVAAARTAKPATPPRDPNLLRITKIALQADQVQREAWRVIADERRGPLRSAFGKLQRAALMALDERLSSKGMFECDRYVHRVNPGASWSATFSEICAKDGGREIATWTTIAPSRARVEFVPQNLREVLGTGASIFGRKMTCELSWGENDVLDELSCPGWEQDRGTQIVRLDTFRYRRNQGQLLSLKGKLMENLVAVRKIESEVPLEGKITVTETELNPPKPDPVKPPDMKPPVGGAAAPLDPDLPKDPNAAKEPPAHADGRAHRRAVPGVPPPPPSPSPSAGAGSPGEMTPEEMMQMGILPPGGVPVAPGVIAIPLPSGMVPPPEGIVVPPPDVPLPTPIAPSAEPEYIPADR